MELSSYHRSVARQYKLAWSEEAAARKAGLGCCMRWLSTNGQLPGGQSTNMLITQGKQQGEMSSCVRSCIEKTSCFQFRKECFANMFSQQSQLDFDCATENLARRRSTWRQDLAQMSSQKVSSPIRRAFLLLFLRINFKRSMPSKRLDFVYSNWASNVDPPQASAL